MVPVDYRLDEAAQAIALQLSKHPITGRKFGRKTLQHALRDAGRNGYVGRMLEQADPEMTAYYREELLKHEVFPRDGEPLSAATTQFQARQRGPVWIAQVAMPVEYELDEAAQAIALQMPRPPTRFGRNTLYRGLREAARNGHHGAALTKAKADPDMVALYREQLIKFDFFPDTPAT
jgi:hypothetical protein